MEQNRPFSREQSHRGAEACGAYWYSLQLILMDTDTLPLRAHTGNGKKSRREEGVGGAYLIVDRKLTWHLLLLICIAQLPCGHNFDCNASPLLRSCRNKRGRRKTSDEFEVLSCLNDKSLKGQQNETPETFLLLSHRWAGPRLNQ